MPIQNSQSDSDLSSDSSWSLLNISNPPSKQNSLEIVCAKPNKESLEAEAELPKKDGEGCKKKSGGGRKQVPDYANLLTIVACLLTITGMTLLTTLLPPSYAESADIEDLQHHLAQVYENANNPTFENAASSIMFASDALDSAKSMDVFRVVAQNLTDETCEAFLPEFYNSTLASENLPDLKIQVVAPYYDEMIKKSQNLLTDQTIGERLKNSSESLFERAKELVKSPGLQMFVATLVQDICLIKLISELTKKAKVAEEDKLKVPKKSKKVDSKRKGKKTKKPTKATKKEIFPLQANKTVCDNNGKSECEKRFEELDTKWSVLGQNHRQRVQQIKNKFQKEINEIKENNFERFTRQQKMQFTREKFIQRLKVHREIFLHSLKKLRDERQEVLLEMCQNFKNFRDFSGKDVSVGNFTILLPTEYDFSKKLEEIRSKERSNLQATNNETVSYIPPPVALENEVIVTEIHEEKNDEEEVQVQPKKKFLSKRAKLMKKRQAKKDSKEVQQVVQDIMISLAGAAPQPLDDTTPAQQDEEETGQESGFASSRPALDEDNLADDEEFQLVVKRKGSKRNINKLYDAAFENKSKKIKKQDLQKWAKKFDEFKWTPVSSDSGMSKQDPGKGHKQKIMHKGVL